MKIKKILVSQPEPKDLSKSPYTLLESKFGVQLDYHKFIQIEGVSSREFRESKVHLEDFTAIIFTSRQAIDHYFKLAEKLRVEIVDATKYFCVTDATANYLQKYVQYRKRKIFYSQQGFGELLDIIKKHKSEKFLLPCSESQQSNVPDQLEEAGINFEKAAMYRTVSSDLKDIDPASYDMLVFFSPHGVKALFDNYPDFKQNGSKVAAFGKSTSQAVTDSGLKLSIEAPTRTAPSMSMAIEQYIVEEEKKSKKKK